MLLGKERILRTFYTQVISTHHQPPQPREGREEQGVSTHVPLVAGVEFDLLVKISKLCFPVAMFCSPPWGSNLLS